MNIKTAINCLKSHHMDNIADTLDAVLAERNLYYTALDKIVRSNINDFNFQTHGDPTINMVNGLKLIAKTALTNKNYTEKLNG